MFPVGYPPRHRAEQYLTDSQQRAQALRQLIGRPQRTQGLLGSEALLPRKPRRSAARIGSTLARRSQHPFGLQEVRTVDELAVEH